ncbi:MAG: hypothetical protein KDD60_08400, partial [Bdellovibrionales bacterium]|nr:hypothetical protein [Bdellovibrionales bacterium]
EAFSSSAERSSVSLAGLPLAEIEERAIRETIQLCEGNKKTAAEMLGISTKSIYNKIHRYGIE